VQIQCGLAYPAFKMNIETNITTVTVYQDRALVVRKGQIQLTGEETELIIPDLPVTLDNNSVRVGGKGKTRVKILAVRTEAVFSTRPVNDDIARLEEEIETLEAQKRTFLDRIEAVVLQNQFIQTLSIKTAERFPLSLAKQETNLTQTEELINFLGDRYLNFTERIASLKSEKKEIDKNISIAIHKLQRIKNPPSNRSNQIVVEIEPSGAGEFELEVGYTVNNARWTPLYDLEVNSDSNSLELSYLAEVRQNTGEDWQGVKLILSTAKPGLGSLPPKLQPWYIDVYAPAPPLASAPMEYTRRRTRLSAKTMADNQLGTAAPVQDVLEESASIDSFQEAEVTNATVDKSGGVVTFDVSGGSNIPNDDNPHKVTIFRNCYPLKWNYLAIPKLVNFAYIQATVTNPAEGVTLLPGTANIFRDNVFIGKTNLNNIVPGETFKLDLGVEEQLKIERDLVERQVDKKFIGDRKKVIYAYRLKIINLLEQNSLLKLREQLPVSRSEKIKVRLDRANPKTEPKEMGILEWKLTLVPQEKAEIYYQFIVEYPNDLTITGLDI
jgi:uncharacterized protein (TIGR02231 family)